MPMTRRNRRPRPDLELRIMVDGQMVIGPVQAMLLEAIRSTGSIAAAQRQMGASYAHVWKLVAAMNEIFSPPLVDPIRGGARGGVRWSLSVGQFGGLDKLGSGCRQAANFSVPVALYASSGVRPASIK